MKTTTSLVFMATMIPSTLLAEGLSPTCENLIDHVKRNQTGFQGVKEVYECGPEFTHLGGRVPGQVEGCLVYFETQRSPFPPLTIAAFDDAANNNRVDWIVPDPSNGIASGWETTGTYFCADIKTYARVKAKGESASVEVIRETARDAMFCPVHKLFTSYETTCRKVR